MQPISKHFDFAMRHDPVHIFVKVKNKFQASIYQVVSRRPRHPAMDTIPIVLWRHIARITEYMAAWLYTRTYHRVLSLLLRAHGQ